ncbi:hypothetical protein AA14337_3181 [Acetobacter malorum DSM 14337]|uniref:Uncharacterized protein n=1 Tax=Acetobacter malorum DSM 14337 TaxID=1307910 RepID=A0ABQ0Q051_9PROT|nr:hypothetical protein AA14337_3181 [Acetobacter malorum DSM 14337]
MECFKLLSVLKNNEKLRKEFEGRLFKEFEEKLPVTEKYIAELGRSLGITGNDADFIIHQHLCDLRDAGKLKSIRIRRNTYWANTGPGSARLPGGGRQE